MGVWGQQGPETVKKSRWSVYRGPGGLESGRGEERCRGPGGIDEGAHTRSLADEVVWFR